MSQERPLSPSALPDAKPESKTPLPSPLLLPTFSRRHPEEEVANPTERLLLARFGKYQAELRDEEDVRAAYQDLLKSNLTLPALYRFANLCYGYWQQQLPTQAEVMAAQAKTERLKTRWNQLAAGCAMYREVKKAGQQPTRYYWTKPTEDKSARPQPGTFYQCYPLFQLASEYRSTALIHVVSQITDAALQQELAAYEQAERVLLRAKERDHVLSVSKQLQQSAAPLFEKQLSDYHMAQLLQQRGFIDQIPTNDHHAANYYFTRLAGKMALERWRGNAAAVPAEFEQAVNTLRDAIEQALQADWHYHITQWQIQTFAAKSAPLLTKISVCYDTHSGLPFLPFSALQQWVNLAAESKLNDDFYDWLKASLQHGAVLDTYKPTLLSLLQDGTKAASDMKAAAVARLEACIQGFALADFQTLVESVFHLLQQCPQADAAEKAQLVERLTHDMSEDEHDDFYRQAVRNVLDKLCQPPKYPHESVWTVATLSQFVLQTIQRWHACGQQSLARIAKAQCRFYVQALNEQQQKLNRYNPARAADPQWLPATNAMVTTALHQCEEVYRELLEPAAVASPTPRQSQWQQHEKTLQDWRQASAPLVQDIKATPTLLQDNTRIAQSLLKTLCDEVEAQLGEAPSEFVLCFVGSGSRGEVSFCSDIDFMLLVPRHELVAIPYFQAFLELLTFKFSVLPEGVLPLETEKLAAQKSGECWIGTPEEFVQRHCFLPSSGKAQTEWDFPARWPAFAYASAAHQPAAQALWQQYQAKIHDFFQARGTHNMPVHKQTEPVTLRALLSKNALDIALEKQGASAETKATVNKANLKAAASSISNAVLCYGRYFGVERLTRVQDVLAALTAKKTFSPLFLQHLATALTGLQHWRLRVHWASLHAGPHPALTRDEVLLWPVPPGTSRDFYLDETETRRFAEIDATVTQVIYRSLAGFVAVMPPEPLSPSDSKQLLSPPSSPSSPKPPRRLSGLNQNSIFSALTVDPNPMANSRQTASSSLLQEASRPAPAPFDPLLAAIEGTLKTLQQRQRAGEVMTASEEDHHDLEWLARIIDCYGAALPMPTLTTTAEVAAAWRSQNPLIQQHGFVCQRLPSLLRSLYLDKLLLSTAVPAQPVTKPGMAFPASRGLRESKDFKALPQQGRPLGSYHDIQFFEDTASKAVWIGRCGPLAMTMAGTPSAYGRYFEEYKEWLGLTLYKLIGVETGDICLSPQKSVLLDHGALAGFDYIHPVVHLMLQEDKNAKPYGPDFMASYRQSSQHKAHYHSVTTPSGTAVPLQGFGALLAAGCLLYDLDCVGVSGQKISYVFEADAQGRTTAKTRKTDAGWVFKFLSSDYQPASRHDPRTRTIHWGKSQFIRFEELTPSDQAEFIQTVHKILQISINVFKALVDQTVQQGAIATQGLSRTQAEHLLTELLARRSQLLEAYLPELVAAARPQGSFSPHTDSREQKDSKHAVTDRDGTSNSPLSSTTDPRFFSAASPLEQHIVAFRHAIHVALTDIPDPEEGWDPAAATSFTTTVVGAIRSQRLPQVMAQPEDNGLPPALVAPVQTYLTQHPELQTSILAQPEQCKAIEKRLQQGEIPLEDSTAHSYTTLSSSAAR